MQLVFDIEANNFLDKITKIHCIVALDTLSKKIYRFGPDEIQSGLQLLSNAKLLIGHNIIDYDLRAIKKLYPEFTHGEVYDTLIAAKVAYPDIKDKDFRLWGSIIRKNPNSRTPLEQMKLQNIGRHSLEAYGLRLGEYKGSYGKENGFEVYTKEMLDYCEQDVIVNAKLYEKLVSLGIPFGVTKTEFEIHRICLEQKEFGFVFDYDKALELDRKLNERYKELQDEIESKLGGNFIVSHGIKTPKRNVSYKEILRGSYKAGCAFTKISFKAFNAGSRDDLVSRLRSRYGWEPTVFGEDKKPTLDETILKTLTFDIAPIISEYFMISKRLGMLSTGDNAWLKCYNTETKCIHGSVNTMGAGTSRCTHSKPNLAQIPSIRAPWGKECRELFTVPQGWRLFGTDASGLELRMLAHYMFRYDNGAYADIVLNGDVHTVNQKAAGLSSRNTAKTFIYAKIYGSGVENLAVVCSIDVKEMKSRLKDFDKNLPALKDLTEAAKDAANGRGYVKGLDGRKVPCRSAHSALNFLLQSAGAIACKMWTIEFHRLLKQDGYVHGKHFRQSAFVHDELQIAFDPEVLTGEYLGSKSLLAIQNVAKELNLRLPLASEWSVGDNYAETH